MVMKGRYHLALLLAVLLPCTVQATSPIAYNTILVIVIIELIFAFTIGVVCVLFSFNLLRALKDASPETLTSGNFPPRRNDTTALQNFAGNVSLNQVQYNPLIMQNMRTRESEDFSHYHDAAENPPSAADVETNTTPPVGVRRNSAGSEWDFETDGPGGEGRNNSLLGNLKGALSTFTGYIKPW